MLFFFSVAPINCQFLNVAALETFLIIINEYVYMHTLMGLGILQLNFTSSKQYSD